MHYMVMTDAESLCNKVVGELQDVLDMIPNPDSDEPLPPDIQDSIVDRLKSIRDGV